jgi:hypothetical protein
VSRNVNRPGAVKRKPGRLKGRIRIAGDFDAPMTRAELAQWVDAPLFPGTKAAKPDAGKPR